ncbi:alpha/beta hydrolase [Segniliparus rugosus]|uniref:alpha/beta hydrolase n=1 Tax=Segniliparus rugosus TaxID=286804 RepID=UPI001FCBD983|nr:alpha/beta hydrolase [Segniliparus rugosus]
MINPRALLSRRRSVPFALALALLWSGQCAVEPGKPHESVFAEALLGEQTHEAAAELDGQSGFAKRYPELIGNRDGVTASVRDQANRSLIPRRRAELEAARDKLRRELAADKFHGAFNDKDSDLFYAERKLEGLAAVERSLAAHPEAKLLLLDMSSGERGKAAIAIGDPDTADHISITTPGINSSPGQTLTGMVDEAAKLKSEGETILRKQGSDESVASIAWIGYDPPQFNWEGTNPGPGWGDELKGVYELSQDSRARAGSESFARFCQGLAAVWRPAADSSAQRPDITVLGHSYGSLVVSLALQQLPKGTVSNAVFYGSPGIDMTETADPDQLGLAPNHAFVLESDDDPIRRIPEWGPRIAYGGFPTTFPWIVRLSTHEGVGVGDGLRHERAHGHAEYPRVAPNGELRMSGYNMAAVVVGRPDLAVKGR